MMSLKKSGGDYGSRRPNERKRGWVEITTAAEDLYTFQSERTQ